MNKTIHSGPRSGLVKIPSSKSVVHRLLICAALGENPVTIRYEGLSEDIRATADCLNALGAEVQMSETSLMVLPRTKTSAPSAAPDQEMRILRCGESGSTLRFLIPVAGALKANVCFMMEGRLPARPLNPFDMVLQAHGMELRKEGDRLFCSGRLLPGRYVLPGNVSSQYLSGLLLALPLLPEDSTLEAEGTLESERYISLTEDALRCAGIRMLREGNTWSIPGGQTPLLPHSLDAEGDWSNAAFFLCMGALSDTGITVEGLYMDSLQGDREILRLVESFGAEVRCGETSASVRKKNCRPLTVDAAAIPDLVPVLSVLACAAEGDTVIRNAARLRLKESDRLRTTCALIRDLGGSAEETEDGLVIHGTGSLRGGTADACNDHRIAMSAAVAASICREPVIIRGAECTAKSYPAFWQHLEEL